MGVINNTSSWQIGPRRHHVKLLDTLEEQEPDVVVCESFQYRNSLDKAVLIPLEYIGVITLWAEQRNRELVMQTPAMGKGFWTDDKLKTLGLYRPGAPHAMDATRHWLYYVTFTLKDKTYVNALQHK